jgi:dTDP-4-dehydrorhamnose 3,5-epimerase
MNFTETELKGAFIIEPTLFPDERGLFASVWNQQEFADRGLQHRVVQSNVALNKVSGTLRGMHFQVSPHQEAKLVRCTAGAVFDAIIDLRPGSPTLHQWVGVELSVSNRLILFVPEGFAHGYQTLEDNSEVAYQISEYYHPQSARGVRWNDPAFGIKWPLPVTVIAERDAQYPLLGQGD